jgi:hypothetical protein
MGWDGMGWDGLERGGVSYAQSKKGVNPFHEN